MAGAVALSAGFSISSRIPLWMWGALLLIALGGGLNERRRLRKKAANGDGGLPGGIGLTVIKAEFPRARHYLGIPLGVAAVMPGAVLSLALDLTGVPAGVMTLASGRRSTH